MLGVFYEGSATVEAPVAIDIFYTIFPLRVLDKQQGKGHEEDDEERKPLTLFQSKDD